MKIEMLFFRCVLTTKTANTSTAEPCFAKAAEAARFRKSRNANRSPIHPSCSTLIAWLGRAAEMFLPYTEIYKLLSEPPAPRDLSGAKCGYKGSRFAVLDLRRFAVSLEMPTDKSKNLLFREGAE